MVDWKSKIRIAAIAVLAVAIVGVGIFAAIAYETSISPISRPDPGRFPASLVAKGAELASIGDCIVCHTTTGGQPYAGSKALPTPFGKLFSDNITPDAETGIGTWSFEAFERAMTKGVSRNGEHLYPALPYEHFTHVDRDDLRAIYAFLMTRPAIQQRPPENELLPGLGFRPLLAGWKLLFLHGGAITSDPNHSSEWNRGRYLAEGLGHCGGCHTPRNLLGGEERSKAYEGGVAEGWDAPPLDATNSSADRWTVDSLVHYLKGNLVQTHGVAAGPMGPVAEGLAKVSDDDVHAIAVYVDSLMHPNGSHTGKSTASIMSQNEAATNANPAGRELFAGACAGCHETGAPMLTAGRAPLSNLTSIHAASPQNAIQALLQGIELPLSSAPAMPSFAATMNDEQLADVLTYVRSRFSGEQAWSGLPEAISEARKENTQ